MAQTKQQEAKSRTFGLVAADRVEALTAEQLTALCHEQDDMIREGNAEIETLRTERDALAARLQQVEQERDRWEAAYKRPLVRFNVWPMTPEEDGKPPRYRVAGYRENGTMVLLDPLYLRDELIAGATQRAERAESSLAACREQLAQLQQVIERVREWTQIVPSPHVGRGGPGPLYSAGLLAQFEQDKKRVLSLLDAAPSAKET